MKRCKVAWLYCLVMLPAVAETLITVMAYGRVELLVTDTEH